MHSNRQLIPNLISVLTAVVLLGGAILIPFASSTPGGEADPSAPKVNATATTGAPAVSSALEVEVRELRDLLEAQRGRIEALEVELKTVSERLAGSPATPARASTITSSSTSSPAADTAVEAVAKKQEALGKKVENVEGRLKAMGPFSFSGDFRLRGEPIFGGPVNQSQVRNRERYRLRFNVNAKLNDDISGGFSSATGDLNDPISTNQTTNQFYTRKAFAIDRAFINYTPHQFKPLTLTGGKFAYSWYNTELTWDKDINPEGLAQTVAWNFENAPVLKRLALVGFELPFAEVAGVSLTDRSIVQSAVYGGQVQTLWQLAGWLKFSGYAGFYNYHNADPIALALATANLSNPQTPNSGLLKLNQSSVQNSITTIAKTTIVTANTGPGNTPTPLPTGFTAVQSAQFASKFGLFDTIARFDIKTLATRWPIAVIGDYVQNTRACANVGNILVAPANTATATFKAVNSLSGTAITACDPHQRRGYWLESRFGRAQERGDWQFAYTRVFIEREAVMGAFNASDIRQNSNVTQHRVEAFYYPYNNVQLGFTGFFGRPLASSEPLLKRLQFDVVYKF
ncbi:MAG: hypothetical protein NVS9B4_11450 [Candidatus Acidiferrum sp.]